MDKSQQEIFEINRKILNDGLTSSTTIIERDTGMASMNESKSAEKSLRTAEGRVVNLSVSEVRRTRNVTGKDYTTTPC